MVAANVPLLGIWAEEFDVAHLTPEQSWLLFDVDKLTVMDPSMVVQQRFLPETLAAELAHPRPVAGMMLTMPQHVSSDKEPLTTHVALEMRLVSMSQHMLSEIHDQLATHFAHYLETPSMPTSSAHTEALRHRMTW
jgi:hypothetical protein